MNEERSEGIVLRAIPHKENDRILTLFTPGRGVMSLYVRGLSRTRPALVNLTTPLCRAEFVFRKGRSDLYRFIDGTILDMHLPLRKSYSLLEVGSKMALTILHSQLPGKSSERLYALLTSFLKALPNASHPKTLWATFQLKFLKAEGLLALAPTCLNCQKAAATRVVDGESRCVNCSSGMSFPFSQEEWEQLLLLFHARQFQPLLDLELPPSLLKGIETLAPLH
ncbi:DNA repair protein RecO [Candidatus Neptunochlamydia vexilliferae]|uniref:DNA repair protein RecO n=1 Tax=Candidatus Neptunichlamydia vexilliferae TaxID=1651774 RepID=UPI001891BAEC|nr:DNA repair protein RecO [Candidatus Neptunochlamydia vexilliferae]